MTTPHTTKQRNLTVHLPATTRISRHGGVETRGHETSSDQPVPKAGGGDCKKTATWTATRASVRWAAGCRLGTPLVGAADLMLVGVPILRG